MITTSPPDSAQLPSLIVRCIEHLNRNEVSQADALLSQIVASHPDIPQALMLMGVVRIEQARHEEAESLLTRTLSISPGQPNVLFYLGNAHRGRNNLEGAIAAYRASLQQRPDFAEAQLALASALQAASRSSEAERLYRDFLQKVPDHAPALVGLGAALSALGKPADAELTLMRALQPDIDEKLRVDVEFNLGLAKLWQRRFTEALAHFEQVVMLAPGYMDADRYRAITLEHLKRPDRAIAVYDRVLAREPLDIKSHLLLNELLHREGRDAEMLRSYDRAALARPTSPVPLTVKGDQLMLLNRAAEAHACYRRAIALSPEHAAAHIGLGRALTEMGEHAPAIATFEEAAERFPNDPDIHTAFAFSLLRQADRKTALRQAEQAVAINGHSQPALAVLDLCYRVNGDPRGEILSDFDNLVQVFDLDPPEGYSSMEDFNRDFAEHLGGFHQGALEFFSQTLRGGTRMAEEIFQYHHPLRDRLKHRMAETVSRYIAAMKDAPDHPFLGRRKAGFDFSGSWSSRMGNGGYHANHIHSGWISSVYYVEVPGVAQDASAKPGWLKLGEPSADIGLRNAVRRRIQPKPGRLVLFPSYMWHGTLPFEDSQPRTTVAFDVVPR